MTIIVYDNGSPKVCVFVCVCVCVCVCVFAPNLSETSESTCHDRFVTNGPASGQLGGGEGQIHYQPDGFDEDDPDDDLDV